VKSKEIRTTYLRILPYSTREGTLPLYHIGAEAGSAWRDGVLSVGKDALSFSTYILITVTQPIRPFYVGSAQLSPVLLNPRRPSTVACSLRACMEDFTLVTEKYTLLTELGRMEVR
jgi:hypothetical protein